MWIDLLLFKRVSFYLLDYNVTFLFTLERYLCNIIHHQLQYALTSGIVIYLFQSFQLLSWFQVFRLLQLIMAYIRSRNAWHRSWFPPVLESPGIWKASWKVLEFEKHPGKSWNFNEILEKSWNFFCGQTVQKRFLSKQQHFLGFLCMLNLAVYRLTAVIFIWSILDAIMSIYSQHITGW